MGEIVNKGSFIESLTEEQFNAGLLKFNIPGDDRLNSLNGEGVWGWAAQEEKEKYNNDRYHDKITVILLNQPLEYFGLLRWGDEVVLRCHGAMRPTLDPDWVKEYLWAIGPSIDELYFTNRISRRLKENGILTVKQLQHTDMRTLRGIKGLGATSIQEIEEKLACLERMAVGVAECENQ